MTDSKTAFIQILSFELEDLQSDIDHLIAGCNHRFEKGEISNYVHMENIGVLENEKGGVRAFEEEIAKMDFSGCTDGESCSAVIEARLDQWSHDQGVVPAARIFIRRKLAKVGRYLAHLHQSAPQ